jgi:hypothetical protein
MDIEKMQPILMGCVAALIGLAATATIAQAYAPQYVCPICGARFATYDELYQHFMTKHEAEPITIIWE